MSNYYLDQEFHEGFRRPIKWLPTIGSFNKPYHFIDLISIGLVCEDGREYYAVCNEFDVRSAYNKHTVIPFLTSKNHSTNDNREYWLRDNVLKPIFFSFYKQGLSNLHHVYDMSISRMKAVVKHSGKTKKQITQDVFEFCTEDTLTLDKAKYYNISYENRNIKFYGYYADYDWVLFCSLFGTMMDLPNGFPMYCIDLKQINDEKRINIGALRQLSIHPDYPKQENEHNALSDARWNKKLHDFLKAL